VINLFDFYAVHGPFFGVKMVGWALAWKFYDRPTVHKRNWSDKVTFWLWYR